MQPNKQAMTNADNAERVVAAMERVLRPFIRLFVGRISCGFMVQRIKRIYIEEARKWIEKNDSDGRVTKSKLAMFTGLDTRTIAAIEKISPQANIEAELCAEAAVLSRWTSSADYQNTQGKPKVLPVMGRGSTFQALVTSSVGRNVTYHTVMERLLDSGNIEIVDDNFVNLLSPFYTPIKATEQTVIDAGSISIARLTKTVAHNLSENRRDSKMFQQDRWAPMVPVEKVPELSEKIRVRLSQQILEIEEIIEEYEIAEDQGEPVSRFGVGWYIFN